jgi:hypothetical protein
MPRVLHVRRPLHRISSALTSQESKTMPEWDIAALERGYVLASQDEYAPDAAGNAECLAAFLDWLHTDGAALTARWRGGDDLTGLDEPQLLWLVKAAWIWRGDRLLMRERRGFDPADADEESCIAYVAELERRGRDAMIRGYLHEPLSDADWQTLREYRILAETRILYLPVWPYELGIAQDPAATPWFLPLGGRMPDLRWRRLEDVLASPNYTDLPTRDPRAIMHPDAAEDFRLLFDGYEARQSTDKRRYVVGKPPELPNDPEGVLRLQDLCGERPVVLIAASATDCFWARAAGHVRALQAAWGDAVEFVWLDVRLWDFLIHSLDTQNYFLPDVGLELPPFARTYEERARWSKKLYMAYADLTLTCALDDPSDTTASLLHEPGGSARVVLLDRDGCVAWHSASWGWWSRTRPPGRTDADAWADGVEREICSLLARGGRFDPEHEPFDPAAGTTVAPPSAPDGARDCWLAHSRIVAVDHNAATVTIHARPVARFTVVDRPVAAHDFYNECSDITVHIVDRTSVQHRNAPMPWTDLAPGDVLTGPLLRLADGRWEANRLQVVSCAHPPAGVARAKFIGDTWMTGRVASVDGDAGACTVERRLPPVDAMKGYNFNREAGRAIQLYGPAGANMDAVTRWLGDAKPNRHCTFRAVADTLVRLNGQPAAVADALPGDAVSVSYDAAEEQSRTIRAGTLRFSRPVSERGEDTP